MKIWSKFGPGPRGLIIYFYSVLQLQSMHPHLVATSLHWTWISIYLVGGLLISGIEPFSHTTVTKIKNSETLKKKNWHLLNRQVDWVNLVFKIHLEKVLSINIHRDRLYDVFSQLGHGIHEGGIPSYYYEDARLSFDHFEPCVVVSCLKYAPTPYHSLSVVCVLRNIYIWALMVARPGALLLFIYLFPFKSLSCDVNSKASPRHLVCPEHFIPPSFIPKKKKKTWLSVL